MRAGASLREYVEFDRWGVEVGMLYDTTRDPFWIRIGPVTWSRGQYTHSELARYNLGICPTCYGPLDHVHRESESPLHKSVPVSAEEPSRLQGTEPGEGKSGK